MYNFDFARRNTRSIFEKRRLFCSRLEGPHRGPSECPSTRERRVQGAVEGSFICSSGLPFLLPARGPLTSPLLLLANCDAADTLVMFSASFVRPLPAPNLPLLPAAHTIFGIGRWWTRKTWNSTANLLCLWDATSTPSFLRWNSKGVGECPPSHPLPPLLEAERGDDFDSKFNWIPFFFFLEMEFQTSDPRFLNFPTKMDEQSCKYFLIALKILHSLSLFYW